MNNEERKKPYLIKRVIAYTIDFIIVALLAASISMVFFQKESDSSYVLKWAELQEKLRDGKIEQKEYQTINDELTYIMAKDSVGTMAITACVGLVYYVVLCYFCHGITLGKYIMKLRIVSANDKELNMLNYLLRALFANLILMYIVSAVFGASMDQTAFLKYYPPINSGLFIFILVTMLFIMYRNDGKGLHDLMSNTIIIDTKNLINEEKEENKDNIVEAKVVKEKKTTKKKSTKKDVK